MNGWLSHFISASVFFSSKHNAKNSFDLPIPKSKTQLENTISLPQIEEYIYHSINDQGNRVYSI